MKVALIPPSSLLDWAMRRPMQMLIPAGIGDVRFDSFYRQFGRRPDYWLMMDNGMFEQPPLEVDRLVKLAEMFNVQEIVLPDVWANMAETAKAIRKFMLWWNREDRAYQPHFQAVIHSSASSPQYSYRRAQYFCNEIVRRFPEVQTFGISRSYSRGLGDPLARVRLAKWISSKWNSQFDIHFLGLEDSYHEELSAAAQFVRSIDTVAPFTAAFHRRYLADAPNCKRPEGYFELTKEAFPIGLITANIRYLDEIASGKIR